MNRPLNLSAEVFQYWFKTLPKNVKMVSLMKLWLVASELGIQGPILQLIRDATAEAMDKLMGFDNLGTSWHQFATVARLELLVAHNLVKSLSEWDPTGFAIVEYLYETVVDNWWWYARKIWLLEEKGSHPLFFSTAGHRP